MVRVTRRMAKTTNWWHIKSEIYRPQTEPQEHSFSGHRHYHCIHTQVVINNKGEIYFIESGFLGHQNDAQQFMFMRQIGNDVSLPFPDNCFLVGDKIYPNRHPVMIPYTRQQIARKPECLKNKCRKLNSLISEYRIEVEHAICELKCYKVMGTPKLKNLVKIPYVQDLLIVEKHCSTIKYMYVLI